MPLASPQLIAEAESLVDLIRDRKENPTKIKKASDNLMAAAQRASREQRNEAVRRIAPLIEREELQRAGFAAVACGSLVEAGADGSPMVQPLLARVLPALRQVAEEPEPEAAEIAPDVAVSAPAPRPRKRPGLLGSLWMLATASYRLRRALKQKQRRSGGAGLSARDQILNTFFAPTIAVFCAIPTLRAAHPELRELSERLSNRVELCHWLHIVFGVLEDEPFLVIEPSTLTGILARVSGTDVNFTLNMLLMHHFPAPDGKVPPRLSPEAAAVLTADVQQTGANVIGVWNLYNWQALLSDLTLPGGQKNPEHWIWNEGKPADIALFEGRRVVLLGPPAYARNWPAQRTFVAMKPTLQIEHILTPDEVRGRLERIAKVGDRLG